MKDPAEFLGLTALADNLQDMEASYVSLVESLPIHFFRKNLFGQFVLVNKAFCQSVNLTREQLIGKTDLELFPRHLAEKYVNDDRSVIESGRTLELDEDYRLACGAMQHVHVVKAPVRNAKQQIIGIQGAFWNVTAHREREQELRRLTTLLQRSNQDLEQYAYVASHDLQEPLRTVSGFCSLLQRKYRGKFDEDADELFSLIVDGTTRMQLMIRNLLEYSRIGRDLKKQWFFSASVVDEVVSALGETVERAQAKINLGRCPEIYADPGEFFRLIQNLISNAFKYHRAGVSPVVWVSAKDRDRDWLFSVQDNGIGLEHREPELVFQIFDRGSVDENKFPGFGIGLASCKRIVEAHDGRIWFDSTTDVGTTFYFCLPKPGLPPR